MDIIKKYKGLVALAFIVIVGTFFFFNQNDNKAVADFNVSYTKFDETVIYFTVSVYGNAFVENEDLIDFGNVFSQIENSFSPQYESSERLQLANQALSLNKKIVDYLNQTDHFRVEARDALIVLNRKALVIKDNETRNITIEITELSKKEFDNIVSYKNVIQEKRDYLNKFLEKIIEDNGGLIKLLDFVKQEDYQIRIQNQNDNLNKLVKEFGILTDSRIILYARFQGLTGIKD